MSTLGRVQCAVLGARGLVAQRLLHRLANHHWLVPTCVIGSPESEGMCVNDIPWSFNQPREKLPDIIVKGIGERGELASYLVSEGVRIVFSAVPDSVSSLIEEELATAGLVVISHSTIHRHSDVVPLIVPEVNADHLSLLDLQYEFGSGLLVSCSNCVVIPLAISIAPILRNFPVTDIQISTEQSLSGGGREMLERSRKGKYPDSEIIGEALSVETELKRILGDFKGVGIRILDLEVNTECRRVPREFGHSARVTLEFGKKVSISEIVNTWKDFHSPVQLLDLPSSAIAPVLLVPDIDVAFSAISEAELTHQEIGLKSQMEVFLGDVEVSGNSLSFTVISDNTVRGAAGNSVLLSELMLAQGIIHDSSYSRQSWGDIRQA